MLNNSKHYVVHVRLSGKLGLTPRDGFARRPYEKDHDISSLFHGPIERRLIGTPSYITVISIALLCTRSERGKDERRRRICEVDLWLARDDLAPL